LGKGPNFSENCQNSDLQEILLLQLIAYAVYANPAEMRIQGIQRLGAACAILQREMQYFI
jgi:hypothetical protein